MEGFKQTTKNNEIFQQALHLLIDNFSILVFDK